MSASGVRKRVAAIKEQPAREANPMPSAPPKVAFEDDDKLWSQVYVPSFSIAFRFLLLCRLVSAMLNLINDCDETFNYYEPLHHWLYGYGLQTWEYSPEFSIRSYAYIILHGLFAWPASQVYPLKVHTFYLVRIVFALWSAFTDAHLYDALARRHKLVGLLLLIFLGMAPGLFVASTSFLPSTFGMTFVTLAYAYWIHNLNRYEGTSVPQKQFAGMEFTTSIVCIAVAVLLGWPFCGAMGIPIFIDFVAVHFELVKFALVAFASLVAILVPMVSIDYFYYGKIVVVPVSIVIYNVLSGSKGPDLYGTEPWTYYVINLFLNLNIVWPLSLLSVPILMVARPFKFTQSFILATAGPYLWLAIFMAQPHKEERFLYVIYPLLCMQGAISLTCIWGLLQAALNRLPSLKAYSVIKFSPTAFVFAAMVVFILLSISRSFALVFNYGGFMETWKEVPGMLPGDLNVATTGIAAATICVSKEWYRFPSHFFVNEPYRLAFVKSDFAGLLPKYYEGSGPASTRLIPAGFNDLNQEDVSRYVNETTDCGWFVDLCTKDAPCLQDSGLFQPIHCAPFLDAANSRSLTRAFYIPVISEVHNTYGEYCLYQRKWDAKPNKRRRNPVKSQQGDKEVQDEYWSNY